MPAGVFRNVLLLGRIAVKLPRLRAFNAGLQCNRWEREMWRVWRPKFRWQHLCPIICADPLGFVVVMPRAEPVTQEEVDREMPDYYPAINAECKAADHGRVGGQLLILDYGLPDLEMVRVQRANYGRQNGPAMRLDGAS